VPSLISAFGRLQPEAVVEIYNLGSAAARRQVSTDARLLLPEESVSAEDVSIDQLVLGSGRYSVLLWRQWRAIVVDTGFAPRCQP